MRWIMMLSVILGIALLGAAVIGGIIVLFIKILRGGSSRKEHYLMAEETQMIQNVNNGLSRLEARVQTLETILLDHDRREGER